MASALIELLAERESELKLRERIIIGFTNALPDLLWSKDTDGRYLWCNQKHVEWLGADSYDEVIGKTDKYFALKSRNGHGEGYHTFGELCANSDQECINKRGPFFAREYGMVRGIWCELAVHKAPLRNDDGEIIGTVGSARNITRQIAARERIIEDFEKVIATVGCTNCIEIISRLKEEIGGAVYDNRN